MGINYPDFLLLHAPLHVVHENEIRNDTCMNMEQPQACMDSFPYVFPEWLSCHITKVFAYTDIPIFTTVIVHCKVADLGQSMTSMTIARLLCLYIYQLQLSSRANTYHTHILYIIIVILTVSVISNGHHWC